MNVYIHMGRIKKYQKLLSWVLKISIFIAALYFIYWELSKEQAQKNTEQLLRLFQNTQFLYMLFIIVLMMFLNWILEAFKWRLLVLKIQNISFGQSMSAILAGLSVGIFTPNRIGEYGGRILYLYEDNRIKGIFVTLAGSLTQMLVTVCMGSIAFVFYVNQYIPQEHLLNYLIGYISLALILLLLYLYFNFNRIASYFLSFRFFRKFRKHINVIEYYHWRDLVPVLILSILRYAVFSLQYYLLLTVFVGEIPMFESLIRISLIFFTQSVLPGFTLTEIGVRGAVAFYFLEDISDNSVGILAAAFSLWLINIILPALTGLVFIIKAKIFDNRH